jgi:hypothetical protein
MPTDIEQEPKGDILHTLELEVGSALRRETDVAAEH